MEMKLDYSDVAFRNDGKLKLLIICLLYTSDAADEL